MKGFYLLTQVIQFFLINYALYYSKVQDFVVVYIDISYR